MHDRRWWMFYTGRSHADQGLVQRVGAATWADLVSWERVSDAPLVELDPRLYEQLDTDLWHDQAWRDPYVFADPNGDGWHMLITARVNHGPGDSRGVIAHATSPDMLRSTVHEPITEPGYFGQLEVPAVYGVDGRWVLVFSCRIEEVPESRHNELQGLGGVWSVAGPGPLGPFDVSAAVRFPHPSLYSGRLVQDRRGDWQLLGFRYNEDGRFVGEIIDPISVTADARGLVPV